jgi:arsenate reductase-like glutaredoxin family protein
VIGAQSRQGGCGSADSTCGSRPVTIFRERRTADPRVLMRTSEPRYKDLGLADATAGELIDAMASHPELIERPVVIWADRAVLARPPELLLPLLETGQNPALP